MSIACSGSRDSASHWDALHRQEWFRPVYPSEYVVRFPVGRFRDALARGERPRALDIGFGGGRHLRLLCELGFEASGVAISREGLDHARAMLARLGYAPSSPSP
jgi:hypothetical protein